MLTDETEAKDAATFVGADGAMTAACQEAVVPFVVKYFPAFPACGGSASTEPHDTALPLVVRNLPALPVCVGNAAASVIP